MQNKLTTLNSELLLIANQCNSELMRHNYNLNKLASQERKEKKRTRKKFSIINQLYLTSFNSIESFCEEILLFYCEFFCEFVVEKKYYLSYFSNLDSTIRFRRPNVSYLIMG